MTDLCHVLSTVRGLYRRPRYAPEHMKNYALRVAVSRQICVHASFQ